VRKPIPPVMINSIITRFISIFPEYPVSDGNILESVPRISKPALQKAEIE
jgi:hypothetical protein